MRPSSRWKYERIKNLKSDLDDHPLMIQVLALEIKPNHASQTLQKLNFLHPLPPHLEHVKRIWRKSPTLNNQESSNREGKQDPVLWLMLGPCEYHFTVKDWQRLLTKDGLDTTPLKIITFNLVPSRMPRTRQEYTQWRESGYWPTSFHEPRTELKAEALELQRITILGETFLPQLVDSSHSVIIVDPRRPIQDAQVQSWRVNETITSDSILDTPIMRAIELVATTQRHSLVMAKDRMVPYLCTDCIIFCRQEPSLMEAMALVHSRAKAVIFMDPDPKRGSLYSVTRLQGIPGLNHYFSVYRVEQVGEDDFIEITATTTTTVNVNPSQVDVQDHANMTCM